MPRGDEHNPASQQEQQRRMLQDWYHAPSGPEPGGADTWQPLPHDIIRVRLTEEWQTCEDGAGVMLALDDAGEVKEGRVIVLRDPTGIIAGSLLADPLNLSMPSGMCLWVIATYDGPCPGADGPYYEPFNFGQCCQGSGSEGSEEGSEGSEGSEESSEGSEGSEEGSGISGERCWIGEPDGPGGLPHHKQPNKIDAPYATCGAVHFGTVSCGMAVDDAGHVIGWWDHLGRWFSPWGYAGPAGGAPWEA